jgi:hypothetical protein
MNQLLLTLMSTKPERPYASGAAPMAKIPPNSTNSKINLRHWQNTSNFAI